MVGLEWISTHFEKSSGLAKYLSIQIWAISRTLKVLRVKLRLQGGYLEKWKKNLSGHNGRAGPSVLIVAATVSGKSVEVYLLEYVFNRYRRGRETCPQAKTSKSGHAIFRRVRATSMTQRRVENTRVHFWTFLPVSVKSVREQKHVSDNY